MMSNFAVIGGAGFIGSHFVDHLILTGHSVKVIDNLCSGTLSRIEHHLSNPGFEFKKIDIENTSELAQELKNTDVIIHLASNPDIARAATDPRIDFVQGTVLTESVLEAARESKVNRILYASGSGVYGDAGSELLSEDSPIKPISTYGASKAAGEHLLQAYSHMFGIKSLAFRFANVVGSRQTHGVGYDFLNRLTSDSKNLHILGNGKQSKSYVHVTDIVHGVLLASEKIFQDFDVFNISTPDFVNVDEIARIVMKELQIDSQSVKITYSGGDRGWKADVPVVRINARKIIDLGWSPRFSSQEAIRESIREMIQSKYL
jgi:UDP-glucose 4-epimerase